MKLSFKHLLLTTALAAALPAGAFAQDAAPSATDPGNARDVQAPGAGQVQEVIVTARRRAENVQDVPLAIAVVTGETLSDQGAFNVNRLTQLQPSLQFYSQNPRNTSVNIRGLGAPLGLTNDGIEQGVGIYVDEVYYNRVASATLDFVDVQQIEVLRGPQGTLYGKNTVAGAINITTQAPTFDFTGKAELSIGNYEFKQAKATISGPLTETIAARLSFSNTSRRGTIYNTKNNQWQQGLDNLGVRTAVLFQPNDNFRLTLSGDWNLQDAICCTTVYARVAPTQRPLNRQYAALAAAQNYAPPSTNPFDRLTDADAPIRARNEVGGASAVVKYNVPLGEFTSVTAWRFWDWGPSNDRDYTGLPITPKSQNPTKQDQWTQEFRFAGEGPKFDYVVGLFAFKQTIETNGTESQGPAASRWTLNPGNVAPGATGCATATTRACIPAVLDGLTAQNHFGMDNVSAALFGKVNWHVTDKLTISPGIRFNYDKKDGYYESVVTGTASDGTRQLVLYTGPYSSDPWIVEQRGQRAPINYAPKLKDDNISYDLTASYDFDENVMAYATYAKAFKSAGINLNGVPVDAANNPIAAAFTIRPERVNHYEAGLKAKLWDGVGYLNLAVFNTDVDDYQANVNNGALGLVRGYLANAEKARIRGVELDFNIQPTDNFKAYLGGAYTDGRYVKFVDAPCPPELSGGTTVTGTQIPSPAGTAGGLSPVACDVSGQWLPGVSKWAGSWGFETNLPATLFGKDGEVYFGYDASYRSKYSSNASRSAYMDVDGYTLHNFRAGFRDDTGFNLYAWVKNAFDEEYFEQFLIAPGSTGLIPGILGDPRTYGLTLAASF